MSGKKVRRASSSGSISTSERSTIVANESTYEPATTIDETKKETTTSKAITIIKTSTTPTDEKNLAKSMNQMTIDFKVVDYSTANNHKSGAGSTPSSPTHDSGKTKSASDEKVNFTKSQLDVGQPMENKSKSMQEMSIGLLGDSEPAKKLVSPYGDWCAFSGGAGSGGCIFTGPYQPMIVPKGDWSDESFESTEESDATVDFCDTAGYTHNNFQNTEIVWAKRPGLPWFPGIIIDPHSMCDKDVKAIMKDIGSPLPNKDQLCDFTAAVINTRQTDKLFMVNLFNRKKTWIWLAESKLRPFCKENDKLFLQHADILHSSYKKELAKAYKKGKKYYIEGEEHVIAKKLVHRHHHHHFF